MVKILVVDDEPDLLKLMQFQLKDLGEVVCAANGTEAINVMNQGGITVAVLDYFLPDMNGFDLAQKIRGMSGNEKLPLIFFSASEEKINEIPSMENIEKLVKPVPQDTMLQTIKKHLGG